MGLGLSFGKEKRYREIFERQEALFVHCGSQGARSNVLSAAAIGFVQPRMDHLKLAVGEAEGVIHDVVREAVSI